MLYLDKQNPNNTPPQPRFDTRKQTQSINLSGAGAVELLYTKNRVKVDPTPFSTWTFTLFQWTTFSNHNSLPRCACGALQFVCRINHSQHTQRNVSHLKLYINQRAAHQRPRQYDQSPAWMKKSSGSRPMPQ